MLSICVDQTGMLRPLAARGKGHASRARCEPELDGASKQLAARLAEALAPWFAREQRDLSWRRTRDPYAIWVSEIMLQQTRVETVERHYPGFVARFPDVGTLAAADEQEVLEAWSGLGYYRRARLLHRGARDVALRLGGHLPEDADGLRAIPGIGRYTAGAIASIAFDRPIPLVDGNVARVVSRLRAIERPELQGADAAEHWRLVRAVLEHGSPRELAQAFMELGAIVCTPRAPSCDACPVSSQCEARKRGLVERIPAPRKKVKQPLESFVAAAVTWRGRLMFVRRPDSGLLAGLWCLPLRPLSSRRTMPSTRTLSKWLGVAVSVERSRSQVVQHVFTHRIWQLHPLRITASERPCVPDALPEHVAWIAPGQRPRGGIPSVTEKLLRALEH
jgi:A/G-specific adenine glycosylase